MRSSSASTTRPGSRKPDSTSPCPTGPHRTLAKLEQLPQRKILGQKKDGHPVFLCADAKDCKCLYVGAEEDHSRFRALLAKQPGQHESNLDPTGPLVSTIDKQRGISVVRCFSAICALLLAILVGCGALQKKETLSMERALSASGFQMRLADTPAKLAKLEKLPQRRILAQMENGKPIFLYADATDCKCLYMGTKRAHQRYKELVARERLATQNEAQTIASDDDWLNVDDFGEWGPMW